MSVRLHKHQIMLLIFVKCARLFGANGIMICTNTHSRLKSPACILLRVYFLQQFYATWRVIVVLNVCVSAMMLAPS